MATTKFSPPPYRWKTIYHSFWVKPVIFHKWIDEDDFGDSDQLVWNKLLLSLTTQLCNLKLYTVALLSFGLKMDTHESIKDRLCALTSKVRCRTTFCAWAAQ